MNHVLLTPSDAQYIMDVVAAATIKLKTKQDRIERLERQNLNLHEKWHKVVNERDQALDFIEHCLSKAVTT